MAKAPETKKVAAAAQDAAKKGTSARAAAGSPLPAAQGAKAVAKKQAAPVPAVKKAASVPAVKKTAPAPAVKQAAAKAGTTVRPVAAPARNSGALPVYSPEAGNPYMPHVATVTEVIRETPAIVTFRVVLDDATAMKNFRFEPGQVGQLSLFGVGEATFVINSPPTRMEYLQFSVMKAGEVTAALHSVKAGDTVGVRAPLGNWFPYNDMKGKDILLVGGGIGMAPLRTLLLYMLDNRKDYGRITLLYGARSPQDMAYAYEVPEWLARTDMETVLTIDREADGWQHKVGLIPNVLLEMKPSPANRVAVVCGPPIMIQFTLRALDTLQFAPEQIFTTLERRMKCGIGLCGRCNIGEKYVCVDGPVFTYAELKKLPDEL